jgi:hypothetical protein
VYGVQALNVICQYLLRAGPLQLSQQTSYWCPNKEAKWAEPIPIPAANFHYIKALHILEPATLCSFNWENNRVSAPCYIFPNIVYGELLALSNMTGQAIENVGISLNALDPKSAPMPCSHLPPPTMSFDCVAGFGGEEDEIP